MDPLRALLARYCDLIDAGNFDGVGDLFAQGALSDPEGTVFAKGARAVTAFYRASIKLYGGSPRTRHVVVETERESEAPDGSVTVRSVYVVLQALGVEARPIVAGRYRDRFGCHAGGWHFLERRFFVDVAGDTSKHLDLDM